MALKLKINKDQFEKLPADIKTEYVEDGEGYKLDVDGVEDTGALKRAKDRESQLRKDAEKELKEAQARLDAIEGDDARKKGDIATLEKKWQSDLQKQKDEYEAKLSKSNGYIKQELTENTALKLATDLSPKHAKILLPHIRSRLVADLDGDMPVTKILDASGKESSLTIEQLRAEFVANKDFSDIITVTKASGGAGNPSQNKSGSAGDHNQQPADLSKASPRDLVAAIEAKKANQQDA